MMDILDEVADRVLERCDLSPIAGKSVLVTGATGLIGTTLLAVLRRASPGLLIGAGRAMPRGIPGVQWTYSASDVGRCDYVLHAAGYAQPARFEADAFGTISAGTDQLVDLLTRRLAPLGHALFLSSAEIYSGSTKLPHTEDDIGTTRPDHPRGAYIEAKRCGEAICHAARGRGIDVRIARPCLAYGPGVRAGDTRLMSELITQGLAGTIRLRDAGAASRTYGYVGDQAEMLLNILLHGNQTIYNVGGTDEMTVRELAIRVAETIGGIGVERPATRDSSGAPVSVRLSLNRYLAEFGKRDWMPFDEGLEQTIRWHRQLS